MKKYLFFILVAVFTCNVVVNSQNQECSNKNKKSDRNEQKREMPTAEQRAEQMAEKLELTDNQTIQVKALFEKQDAEKKKERAEAKKQMDAKEAQVKANRDAQDAELEKILGKEKFQKLEIVRAEQRGMMKQRETDRKNHHKKEDYKGCRCN